MAFAVPSTIIFFSALMAVLYHLGVLQWIVRVMATVIVRVLPVSGAETLAACANVLDNMTSLCHWDGKLQEDSEAVLIAKTRDDLVEKLIERVKALHSYDCPCVVSWPIEAGNPAYLDWIRAETVGAIGE